MSSKAEIQALINAKDYKAVIDTLSAEFAKTQNTSPWKEAALAESYYQQKESGAAIVHTQNLILLDRRNMSARGNLEFLQKSIDGQTGTRMSHPADFGFELSSWIRAKESASMAFVALNLFLLLRFFKKPQPKRDVCFGALIVIFLLLSGLAYYGQSVGVLPRQSSLRQKPVELSELVKDLPAGARVRRLRTSGSFVEIERAEPSATRGWVKQSELVLFY